MTKLSTDPELNSKHIPKDLFDPDILPERLGGDEQCALDILDCFLRETSIDLVKAGRAVNVGNRESLECIAHGIKGTAANIGAEQLHLAAGKLEQSVRLVDEDNIQTNYMALREVFDNTYIAIKNSLKRRRAT